MAKSIKIEDVQDITKELYEMCSEIAMLQKELDQMLTSLEKNSKDYNAGKISRQLFRYNESRMKKECAKVIKSINSYVDKGCSIILKMGKKIESQKILDRKPRKKDDIKERIAAIQNPQEQKSEGK